MRKTMRKTARKTMRTTVTGEERMQAAAGFGCNTYSYIQSVGADECLSRLADMGFREFEVMFYPGHLWPPEVDGIRRLRAVAAARGLRIVSLNMPNIDINIAAAAPEMRGYSLGMLETMIRVAGELGVSGLIVGPGKPNPLFPARADELTGYFYRALDRLAPLAEAAGTALWVENMPFAFLPGIAALMQAVEAYGEPRIGVVYDVANAHFIGEDIGAGLMRCRERLRLVHLSDTGRAAFRHDPVGQGDVPFGPVPAQLRAAGYQGPAMIEIISHDPDRDIPDSVGRLTRMGFGPARATERPA